MRPDAMYQWCLQLYDNSQRRMDEARIDGDYVAADDIAYAMSKIRDMINYLAEYLEFHLR